MFVNESGFSWNEDAKMVVVEKSVFNLWVKNHPTAKGLCNKPFPHYDTLLEIFGKDRANGLRATTLAQEEETIKATAANEGGQSTQYNDGLDGIEVSSTQPQASPTGCSQQKARKSSDGWTRGIFEVPSLIKNLVDGTMVYLDKIGNAMSEDSTMKKEVAAELQKIDGLTLTDIMNAGKDIITDSYLSTMFLSLPEEKRREMVLEVLKKHTQS
ncbi:hypothetical protein L1049_027881 [Liquidambar formosana]|uniref:Myb/SANT-like domain-containing protein n=1 Tax=Liquidambar formosana TaxID=63359 RepID=A0AAP0RHY5_LIQFO